MKKLVFLVLLMAHLCSCGQNKKNILSSTSNTAKDTIVGIKGCESARYQEEKLGKSFTYPKNKVLTIPSEEGVGEEIYLTTEGGKDTFWIENIEAHHFHGIKNGLLFVDNGTAPNGRSILIYDIKNRKLVHETKYEKEIRFENGKMIYMTPIDTRNIRLMASVCPDREKWEKQGFNIGYAMLMSFDLKTLETEESGDYTCFPIQ